MVVFNHWFLSSCACCSKWIKKLILYKKVFIIYWKKCNSFQLCRCECGKWLFMAVWGFNLGSSFGFSLPFAGLLIRFPVIVGNCGNQSGHFKSFQAFCWPSWPSSRWLDESQLSELQFLLKSLLQRRNIYTVNRLPKHFLVLWTVCSNFFFWINYGMGSIFI